MLELYKGQLDMDDFKYKLSYREALIMRETRIERLKREREEIEEERKKEAERMKSEQARQSILRK